MVSYIINLYPIDYVEEKTKWCYPKTSDEYLKVIKNEEDAKAACTNNEECKMFYRVGSGQQGYAFCYSRTVGATAHSSAISSTLYMKCKRSKNFCQDFNRNISYMIRIKTN